MHSLPEEGTWKRCAKTTPSSQGRSPLHATDGNSVVDFTIGFDDLITDQLVNHPDAHGVDPDPELANRGQPKIGTVDWDSAGRHLRNIPDYCQLDRFTPPGGRPLPAHESRSEKFAINLVCLVGPVLLLLYWSKLPRRVSQRYVYQSEHRANGYFTHSITA